MVMVFTPTLDAGVFYQGAGVRRPRRIIDGSMLDVHERGFAGTKKDESRRLRARVFHRGKSHAAIRERVVVVAIRQADPEVVSSRLRPGGRHDTGRTVFKDDEAAGMRLEGDVVQHSRLLTADNEP